MDLQRKNLEDLYETLTALMRMAKDHDPDAALRIRQCESIADNLVTYETEDDIQCLEPAPERGADPGDYLLDTLYRPRSLH